MIIFVCGGGGLLFVAVFILILLGGITDSICSDITRFFEDNQTAIIIVTSLLTLLLSAAAGYLKQRIRVFLAHIPLIGQLFYCLLWGLYSVVTRNEGSFFLLVWTLIIYAAVFIVDAFLSVAVTVISTEYEKSWPIFAMGIGAALFQSSFW